MVYSQVLQLNLQRADALRQVSRVGISVSSSFTAKTGTRRYRITLYTRRLREEIYCSKRIV